MRHRSLFWPGALILVGVIALLVTTGLINGDRLVAVVALWPLILVVVGLELIVRRSVRGAAADVAALLVIVLAIAAVVGYVVAAPAPPGSSTLDLTGAMGELPSASVEIDVGSAEVTMKEGAGSDLFRLHITYAGDQPEVSYETTNGNLQIAQKRTTFFGFRAQRFVMTLQVNPHVPWTITENTGASSDTFDLAHTRVNGIAVDSGAAKEDITLGPPHGVVAITLNAGAVTAHLHRPVGTKVAAEVSGGAVSLDVDGHRSGAVGRVGYTSSELGSDYYRIGVSGGACTVTLDAGASPSD